MSACKISRDGTTDQPPDLFSCKSDGVSDPFILSCPIIIPTFAPEKSLLLQVSWPSVLLKNRENQTGCPRTELTSLPCVNGVPRPAGLTGSHIFSILAHNYQFLCPTCSALLPSCSLHEGNHDANDHISS